MKLMLAISVIFAVSACKQNQVNSGIKADADVTHPGVQTGTGETVKAKDLQEFLASMKPVDLSGFSSMQGPFCTEQDWAESQKDTTHTNEVKENIEMDARGYILPHMLSPTDSPNKRVIESLVHTFTYQGKSWKVRAECRENKGVGEKIRLEFSQKTGFPYIPGKLGSGSTCGDYECPSFARDGSSIEVTDENGGYEAASDRIIVFRQAFRAGTFNRMIPISYNVTECLMGHFARAGDTGLTCFLSPL